jgi:hypothetical protein
VIKFIETKRLIDSVSTSSYPNTFTGISVSCDYYGDKFCLLLPTSKEFAESASDEDIYWLISDAIMGTM